MIKLRIPVNLLNYKATIMGMEISKILTIFMTGLAGIIAFRITFYPEFLLLVPLPVVMNWKIGESSIIERTVEWMNFVRSKKDSNRKMNLTWSKVGNCTLYESGRESFTLTEIRGMEVSSLRDRDQISLYSAVEKILNGMKFQVDFFHTGSSGNHESSPLGERTKTVVKIVAYLNNGDQDLSNLIAETSRFRTTLESVGFVVRDMDGAEAMNLIGQISAGHNSNSFNSLSINDENEGNITIKYRKHRRYVTSEVHFTDAYLEDSQYDLGPSYLEILKTTGIDFVVKLSFVNIGGGEASAMLKRMIAERKAEARSAGSSFLNSGNRLKMQIDDGIRMLRLLQDDDVLPCLTSLIIRVADEHPVMLNLKMNRMIRALELAGMKFKILSSGRNQHVSLFESKIPVIRQGTSYLMNTRSVATILPIMTESDMGPTGITIGYNELNDQKVYLDVFSRTSHNSLILGETGSGKSFFAKALISKSVSAWDDLSVIIFDPLNEYHCIPFGTQCREFPLKESSSVLALDLKEQQAGVVDGIIYYPCRIFIVKSGDPEEASDSTQQEMFLDSVQRFIEKVKGKKLVVVDESHLLMKNNSVLKKLDSLMRHSRHYNSSIVCISQNVSDFTGISGRSLVYNSANVFIFRTRSLKESDRQALKLDDFDTDPPETLLGGTGHPYSECLYTDGTTAKKVRIMN